MRSLKFFSFMSLTYKAFCRPAVLALFPAVSLNFCFSQHFLRFDACCTHLWDICAMSEPSTPPPSSSPISRPTGEVKGDREFREHVEWMAFLPAVSPRVQPRRPRCETVKRTRCDSLDGTVDFLVALRCFIP